jgi:hypothetical protein
MIEVLQFARRYAVFRGDLRPAVKPILREISALGDAAKIVDLGVPRSSRGSGTKFLLENQSITPMAGSVAFQGSSSWNALGANRSRPALAQVCLRTCPQASDGKFYSDTGRPSPTANGLLAQQILGVPVSY